MRIIGTLIALSAFAAADASAVGQRTFVSGTGQDSNVSSGCQATLPCRSFAVALSVTNAKGEIVVLDSAGYGAVTIAQDVTIQVPSGVYAGVAVTAGDGVVVNGASTKAVLRGLTINGQGGGGRGILVNGADTVRIEGCTITNMTSDGIQSIGAGTHLHVYDSLITNNGGNGIYASGAALVEVERTRIERGGFIGVQVANGTKAVTLRDVAIVANTDYAIEALPTGASVLMDVTIERALITENGGGAINGFASLGAGLSVAITGSTFVHNNSAQPGSGVVRINATAPASAQASIEHTVLQRNNADAVQVPNAGAHVTVSNSTIVSNVGYAISNLGVGVVYTRQNNTIRGNFSSELANQNIGPVTALTGG
jgi:hypothetical protein